MSKTIKSSLYLLIFSFLFIQGCKKKEEDTVPTNANVLRANFSAKQYHADIDDFLFEFTNVSENALRYEWTFGDGTESNLFEPGHVYENYGTYEVTLFAFNKDNNISEMSVKVTYGPHSISKFYIDSIQSFSQNYIDTFVSHNFHLETPLNKNAFDLSFDQLSPLEFTSNYVNIDLNYWSTYFEVQIGHNPSNGPMQCSNFEATNVLSKILITESLNHNIEFNYIDRAPCKAQIINKIYGRFEVQLKLM